MGIEKEQLLSDTFHILSSELLKNKNIDGLIHFKMKKMYENKCSKNGYVLPDSLEIVQRSVGKVITINNRSYVQFNVNYKIKSIIPCKGDIYKCIIDSITRMGVIAYLNYKNSENSEIKDSPVLIIVPKEYFDDDNKLSDLKLGDTITIKVLDSRIKYMSTQIQVIGEPVLV